MLNGPPETVAIFSEARKSLAAGAPTGAVILCRKILMHVAVHLGAKANQSFQHYVEWLIERHYVPTGSEKWLDYIRSRGNDANHEIDIVDGEAARSVVYFTETLLKIVYELPGAIPSLDSVGEDGVATPD